MLVKKMSGYNLHSLEGLQLSGRGVGRCSCGGSSGRTAGFLPGSAEKEEVTFYSTPLSHYVLESVCACVSLLCSDSAAGTEEPAASAPAGGCRPGLSAGATTTARHLETRRQECMHTNAAYLICTQKTA